MSAFEQAREALDMFVVVTEQTNGHRVRKFAHVVWGLEAKVVPVVKSTSATVTLVTFRRTGKRSGWLLAGISPE